MHTQVSAEGLLREHACEPHTFALFTSTTSSIDNTPTAPPVNDATMGSTSLSCFGRPTLVINSAYDVPLVHKTTTRGESTRYYGMT